MYMYIYIYIYIYIYNTVQKFGFGKLFWKKSNQGCIYLIKNTVKQ